MAGVSLNMTDVAVLAVLAAVIAAIVRGMLRGSIRSCDEGSCAGDCAACHGECTMPQLRLTKEQQDELDALTRAATGMTETILGIDGMMCGMCEVHVNDAIRRHFSVKSCKSNHRTGQCTIVSETELGEDELRQAIGAIGYQMTSYVARPYK